MLGDDSLHLLSQHGILSQLWAGNTVGRQEKKKKRETHTCQHTINAHWDVHTSVCKPLQRLSHWTTIPQIYWHNKMQYRNRSEGGGVYVTDSAHALGAPQLAVHMGRMWEDSAESVILPLKSRTNSVPGRKRESFPVTLQVFFHELISNPRNAGIDEPPKWHIRRNVGKEKVFKKSLRKKGTQCSVLTSYNAASIEVVWRVGSHKTLPVL